MVQVQVPQTMVGRPHTNLAAKCSQNVINVVAGTSIRGSATSISLADPGLSDCPLVAVSEGFEQTTGYKQQECVGQNCRFLNDGCDMKNEVRMELRKAVSFGTEFLCVLDNRTKQGVEFKNLLHMTTIRVGTRAFIVGIQCDVTNTDFDNTNTSHIQELQQVVDRIFAANLDAWIGQAASDFQASLPVPYSQVLKENNEEEYNIALKNFVALENDLATANQSIIVISQKNTFVHAEEVCEENKNSKIKRSMSDPNVLHRVEDYDFTSPSTQPDTMSSNAGEVTPAVLSSVGSMGHADGRCTPCKFFLDKMGLGCRSGYDCRFCHEVHQKNKAKKKRKAKEALANAPGGYPVTANGNTMPANDTNSSKNLPGVSEDSVPNGECHFEVMSGKPALMYVPPGHSTNGLDPNCVQAFNFGVGQCVALPAVVLNGQTDMKAMEPALSFSIFPPLPNGLSMDTKTGDISGIVQHPSGVLPIKGHTSEHKVEVRIQAVVEGSGVPLGDFLFCEASIQIRLLDISVLLSHIRWIEEGPVGAGILHVECADVM